MINDARNALRLTGKSYDAIVSQPSHPWTAGASHLFTREFVAEARNHLNEGGVFLQWMNAEFVDEPLLRSLAATLVAEYDYVRLYHPMSRVLMFLASEAPLDVELELAQSGRPIGDAVTHFNRIGINGVEDLLTALVLDEDGVRSFARFADISTDDNNLMATRSRPRGDGLQMNELMDLFIPYDPLGRAEGWVRAEFGERIDYGYIARRLAASGQTLRATEMAAALPDFSTQFEIFGLLFRAAGQSEQARESLTDALGADPLNMRARYSFVSEHINTLARGEAPEDIQAIAAELSGTPATVIEAAAHQAAGDWESLAALDEALAESAVTDIWYPEAAQLRAEWRLNTTDNREQLAAEALQIIEDALIIAPVESLHRLRVMSARTLGDADRLVESSSALVRYNNDYLTALANSGYRMTAEELAQARESLVAITNDLGDDLQVADPNRRTEVRDNANTLIRYLDEYPLAPDQ